MAFARKHGGHPEVLPIRLRSIAECLFEGQTGAHLILSEYVFGSIGIELFGHACGVRRLNLSHVVQNRLKVTPMPSTTTAASFRALRWSSLIACREDTITR